MNEFSLEKLTEQIYSSQTKEYFKEVISSYHNENYRSATVMLWSVVVCDILEKLQHLVDLYGDKQARTILENVKSIQSENAKSSSWEMNLVKDIWDRTFLLNNIEFSNLEYLQNQRHLSAHPVLDGSNKLHSPNKETVRSLLRNALEGVLVKPPLYTNKILDELLQDLSENSHILDNKKKVKRYVENKYFQRTTVDVELQIFKSLWKLVFQLENDDCNKNRQINYYLIWVLAERNKTKLEEFILNNSEYFGKLSTNDNILWRVVAFLARLQPLKIYDKLPEYAQMQVTHCIQNHHIGKITGWFIKDSLQQHFDDLVNWISEDEKIRFSDVELEFLSTLQDSEEWEQKFCQLISIYYANSRSFEQANDRFETSLNIYLDKFNLNSLHFLLEKVEENSHKLKVLGVSRLKQINDNDKKIINRVLQLVPEFDFTSYSHFNKLHEEIIRELT